MLKKGFYTAVGTPQDNSGSIILESLKKQLADQITAGASGILLFGTMGIGGCITNKEVEKGIKAAIEAVKNKCKLLVGASENSVSRVSEKIDIVNKYDVDGVVITPPYYLPSDDNSLMKFFRETAAMTTKDYYLYDNLAITKQKISFDIVKGLLDIPNFKGIKSGDLFLVKQLSQYVTNESFTPIFSDFLLVDVAYMYGINHYLDGIFACMPKSITKVQENFNNGSFNSAKKVLNEMVKTRAVMLNIGIWPAFTYAMNLLGYEGNYGPDYIDCISDEDKVIIKNELKELGEI